MISEISSVTHRQRVLLAEDEPINERLMLALDSLNRSDGCGTVKVSTQGAFKDWEMRQERKSPNYRTARNEVPLV